MKIAVITPIPTPYRDGFWNVLARQEGIELTVFYCAAGKGDRPWRGDWRRDYRWEVLPGRNLLAWRGPQASLYDNPAVKKRLAKGRFEAVLIGGYNHPTLLAAMRWCRRHDVPYFLMSESHLLKRRNPLKQMLKAPLLRHVVRHMAGGFPTGTLAAKYLLHYGADPATLAHLPNAPDVQGIRAEAERLRPQRGRLRAELGLSARPTVLFVGRLIPKKGAHLLLEALARVEREPAPDLILIGDGPERARLARQAQALGLAGRVRFAGFVEPADMVRWYVAADLFVLPSAETWGVVVAEALAAGLPVVVSDRVGCHPDVIGGLEVGRVVPHGDVPALAAAMAAQLSAAPAPGEIAKRWQGVAECLRYEALAGNTLRAIRAGTARPVADESRAVA